MKECRFRDICGYYVKSDSAMGCHDQGTDPMTIDCVTYGTILMRSKGIMEEQRFKEFEQVKDILEEDIIDASDFRIMTLQDKARYLEYKLLQLEDRVLALEKHLSRGYDGDK